jgi:thioredoxin reductase (NADPH)
MRINHYDFLIAGTGAAGSTGGLYGQRLGLKTIVFGDTPGGITYMIDRITDLPGFPGGVSGSEFGVKLFQQAQMEGAMFTMSLLNSLDVIDNQFTATDANGLTYTAPCAVVATGRLPKRLPVAHAEMKGVTFCSVCDGPLFRDKNATLAVVGSSNAAGQHALTLSRIAARVLIICRSQTLLMDAAHRQLIASPGNIEVLTDTEVTGYIGLDSIEGVSVKTGSGNTKNISVNGLFVAIGWEPNASGLNIMVNRSSEGYLKTDERLMTSQTGLFAAGDIREKKLHQVLTACADGAMVAKYAFEYLKENDHRQ